MPHSSAPTYRAGYNKNMWRIIILCLCVSASANGDFETFRKCCPEGQNLIRMRNLDTENLNLDDTYECLDSEFEATYNISNPYPTLFVAESVTVEYGMPEDCSLKMMVQYDGDDIQLTSSRNHCYDRLVMEVTNRTVKQVIPKTIALVCNGSDFSKEYVKKINNIRKCCPPGQTYDTEFHMCRTGDAGYDKKWLIKKLNAFGKVFEFDHGLYCKSSEYAVELTEDKFSTALEGNRLNILSRSGSGGEPSPQGNWCVDREYTSRQLVARVCTQDCTAYDALCIRKCCPVGEHYVPFHCGTLASQCVPNTDDKVLFDLSVYIHRTKKRYGVGDIQGIRTNILCGDDGKIALNRSAPHDWHHLTRNGALDTAMGVTTDYCLEVFDTRFCGINPYVSSVVCFIKPKPFKNFTLSFVLNSLSAACLALTLVVYCAIPELRNLHGRNLICHVSMMLIAYACLARVQYEYVSNKSLCIALGYGIYFGFVAAFAWLNVMCADIWWTFGSVRTVQPLHKGSAGRRKFLWYSLYAWGVSSTLTLTMFLLDKFPVSEVLDANVGSDRCWFGAAQNTKSDWPHYIFFVIPMGLVSCSNFVLWLLTARHCARVKSEVHRLQAGSVGDRAKKRFRVDRANFVLTGKLWVVMGAGWTSELISTLASNPISWIWTIVDMINELQGVMIFIILIFKPKLYYLIRKKLGFSRTSKDPRLAKPDAQKNGPSSSGRTSSTFLSRTVSTDERTHARVSIPNDSAKQL